MKKIVWLLISCMAALSLVLLSCGPAAVEEEEEVVPTEEEEEEEEEEEVQTGELVFVSWTGVGIGCLQTWYDPTTDFKNGSIGPCSLAWDSLVAKDAEGHFVPSLATSWEIAEDWSRMDFWIREGVEFHNGEPCTAEDVKFSFDRIMAEDSVSFIHPEFVENIDRVEIVDDYHIRVHLRQPYPAFLQRCFELFIIVPKDYIEEVGDAGFAAKPIGTGPFRLVEFNEPEAWVKFEALPKHFRQTPYIKTIVYKEVTEATTRLAMLKTGNQARSRTYGLEKQPALPLTERQSQKTFSMARLSHGEAISPPISLGMTRSGGLTRTTRRGRENFLPRLGTLMVLRQSSKPPTCKGLKLSWHSWTR